MCIYMCMSCHSSNRKRIAIIAGAGAGATGVITYVSLAANPVAAAALPVVLAFAACPAMCAAMGGIMWLSRRMSKKKNMMILLQEQQQPIPKVEQKVDKSDEGQNELHGTEEEVKTIVKEEVLYAQKQQKRKVKRETVVEGNSRK
jgi:hypothetical protein